MVDSSGSRRSRRKRSGDGGDNSANSSTSSKDGPADAKGVGLWGSGWQMGKTAAERGTAREWAGVVDLARRLNDPTDTVMASRVALALWIFEAMMCAVIVRRVAYTEIDWEAYMSQVKGFLGGERDYTKLKGDTGPLVYPAGYLYIFSGLFHLTSGGAVFPAQICFAILYLANLAAVFYIYIRSAVSVPPWAYLLLCLSKRLHSIFLLRLFNDCFAMFLAYLSISALLSRRWILAATIFSAGVSVKMNLLLFAPGLAIVLLKRTSIGVTIAALTAAGLVQLLAGIPFLLSYPWEYLSRAFNFSRVFIYFWSVNFKFVREDIFVSKPFAVSLLAAHLLLLFLFAHRCWLYREGGVLSFLRKVISGGKKKRQTQQKKKNKSKETAIVGSRDEEKEERTDIATIMFTANFVGIVCARSLHYQFYSWYFHTIPYLLWCTPIATPVRLLLWVAIEYCWNVFPSTAESSLLLLAAHLTILAGLLWRRAYTSRLVKSD